jgi:uncharacterized membrane protein
MTAEPRKQRRRVVIAMGFLATAAIALGISRVATPADAAKARHSGLWTLGGSRAGREDE